MDSPQHAFVNVAGVNPNGEAKMVFVWSRRGAEGNAPLASSHVVRAAIRPPGIQAGQFSVTFRLPSGSSIDDLFVTGGAATAEPLTGVKFTPCATVYSVEKLRAGVASLQDAAVLSGS